MAVCPDGHQSGATDWCDECGKPIGGSPRARQRTPEPAPPTPTDPPAAADQPCPVAGCDGTRTGRFCEECGYDFDGPPPTEQFEATWSDQAPRAATSSGWVAVATADRDYYDQVRAQDGTAAAAVPFPAYCPERQFTLDAARVHIGRHSRRRGYTPEIDLSGPPPDTGVSHLHAILEAQPDGTWTVIDPGSTNGTTVNGGLDPIPRNTPTRVGAGDRIHLGGWTTLTLVRHHG